MDRFNIHIFLLLICTALNLQCSDTGLDQVSAKSSDLHVQDGFVVDVAAGPELVDYPMFATLDPTGRLFVFESIGNVYESNQAAIDTPQFRIKLLEDLDRDGLFDRATVYADSLSFPQGGVFYEGSLYASAAPDLLKLTDTDGDGRADEKEVILSGWILNVNANSLIGPFLGPDGWLYMTSAIMGFDVASKEGEQMKGETARIWRVRPDGSELEWVSAGGMNNPVELTFTASGEVIGTQTFFVRPQKGLRDALTFWVEGGIYGKKNSNITRDGLPRTGDLLPVVSSYSRVAPSGIGSYRSAVFGEEFRNNLFSAQFNTHRVIRHQLERKGASFATEDEIFLWSDSEDFHPTDVLESGDGSLLVVETGGWFILGCPLSQVSKPQLKGSIYRIRPVGTPLLRSPYGDDLTLPEMPSHQLTQLLHDERPFVREEASKEIISRGEAAVSSLSDYLQTAQHTDARIRAIFALHQINTKSARLLVRTALTESDPAVSIAAARCCGLAKDTDAIAGLLQLLTADSKACRRQSATALGQIGDPVAIPPLLAAAEGEVDVFVLHTITYALLEMSDPDQIEQGLSHQDTVVQRVAITALDQHKEYTLRWRQLMPLLQSDDAGLQRTALSIAKQHPEWSSHMLVYLDQSLGQAHLPETHKETVKELLINFSDSTQIQYLIGNHFAHGAEVIQKICLGIMQRCSVDPFPASWTSRLADELTTPSSIRLDILDLIRHHQITDLADYVQEIARNPKAPLELRIKALGTKLPKSAGLVGEQFDFLLESLQKSKDLTIHQKITNVLLDAELTNAQCLHLLTAYLPVAEKFMLPKLMPVFASSNDPTVGKALSDLLLGSPALDNIHEDQIRATFRKMPTEFAPNIEAVVTQMEKMHEGRLSRLHGLQARLSDGDEGRGRALYFGKATCWTCHRMGDEGGDLGPDLTAIDKDRSQHDILEAILYPNVSFVREYETYQVQTKDHLYTGTIREQSPDHITLVLAPNHTIQLQRSDISDIQLSEISLMPQGLGDLLTDQEMSDLLSFLKGEDLIY